MAAEATCNRLAFAFTQLVECHILALVSQAGHDLAGRQVLELLTAWHSQSRQAFRIAELLPSNQHLRC